MKKITDKELLQLQLDILRDVDSFCRKNGIEYFLVGGTGIGAVRHGGYIPWDDDIDIGMTRPNYNRFLEMFNGTFSHLKVYAPEINLNYYAPYANVCDTRTLLDEGANGHRKDSIGVKIDVFPYDPVPSDISHFEKLRSKSLKLMKYTFYKRRLIFNSEIGFIGAIKTIIWKLILLPVNYTTLQKRALKLTSVLSYNEAEYLEKIVFPYDHNKPCKKEVFELYIDMPFENIVVRNLKEYDMYLKSVFGNYLQLPPKEQQIPHHGFTAYWKD